MGEIYVVKYSEITSINTDRSKSVNITKNTNSEELRQCFKLLNERMTM